MGTIHLEVETTQGVMEHLQGLLRRMDDEFTFVQRSVQRLAMHWSSPATEVFFQRFRGIVRAHRQLYQDLQRLLEAGNREIQEWLEVDRRLEAGSPPGGRASFSGGEQGLLRFIESDPRRRTRDRWPEEINPIPVPSRPPEEQGERDLAQRISEQGGADGPKGRVGSTEHPDRPSPSTPPETSIPQQPGTDASGFASSDTPSGGAVGFPGTEGPQNVSSWEPGVSPPSSSPSSGEESVWEGMGDTSTPRGTSGSGAFGSGGGVGFSGGGSGLGSGGGFSGGGSGGGGLGGGGGGPDSPSSATMPSALEGTASPLTEGAEPLSGEPLMPEIQSPETFSQEASGPDAEPSSLRWVALGGLGAGLVLSGAAYALYRSLRRELEENEMEVEPTQVFPPDDLWDADWEEDETEEDRTQEEHTVENLGRLREEAWQMAGVAPLV